MSTAEQKLMIGIDLGTTNSVFGIVKHGQVMVLKNCAGSRLTPSCVSFSEDTAEVLVGTPAIRKKGSNYKNTVFDVKRLLGWSWNDACVKRFCENSVFTMVDVGGKPVIEVTHNGQKLFQRPLEISSRVLKYICESAEQALRGKSNSAPVHIESAVITVPAYFQQAQKSATIEAAKLAGIKDVHIITEPTAAAFGYGFAEKCFDELTRLLVFDFGGGTFDVSVMEVNDGRFETRYIKGDANLGGRDLDILLRDYCAKEIKTRWKRDCLSNKLTAQKLLDKCEELKIALSTQSQESIYLGDLFDLHAKLNVSREVFENLSRPLFTRAMSIVKLALRGAGFDASDIDEVLLVGGTSRIPALSDMLVSEVGFSEHKLNKTVNEDEVVAAGAAVYAAKIAGTLEAQVPMTIVDVIPLSLGESISNGVYVPVIPRSSTIPCKITKTFVTSINNQYVMGFDIFEGERKIASKNNKLGSFSFTGLAPGMAGSVHTDLTFEVDKNGILHVSASHKGRTETMPIDYEMRSTNEPDVEEALREAMNNLEWDTMEEVRRRAKSTLETEIERAKYNGSASILAKCRIYEVWIKDNPNSSADVYNNKTRLFRADIGK